MMTIRVCSRSMDRGKDPELKHQEGGYDAFKTPKGEAGYAVKGPGFVAFGPDQALIAAIARPGEKTLDKALTPALAKQFLAGDVGVYVSASALVARYSEQIDQARQTIMGALDKAGQQAGNAGTMNTAKEMYGALFDSLKDAEALTISVDVAAEGLSLAGVLTVKPDTALAKAGARGRIRDCCRPGWASPGRLVLRIHEHGCQHGRPASGHVHPDDESGGKPTPDQAKALALFGELGRVETTGSITFDGGMRNMNVTHVADPKKYIAACQASIQALKGGEGPSSALQGRQD